MGKFTNHSKVIVTFDLDDTLVTRNSKNHTEFYNDAYVSAMNEIYGTSISLDDLRGTDTTVRVIQETMQAQGIQEKVIDQNIEKCMALMTQYFEEFSKKSYSSEEIRALSGVNELLAELRNHNISFGLITGTTKAIAKIKLKIAGIDKYFPTKEGDFLFGGYGEESTTRIDLIYNAYQRALDRFGILLVAYHIGDSMWDIRGFKQIESRFYGKIDKIKTIAIATGNTPYKELKKEGPTYIFRTLDKNIEKIMEIIKGK